MTFHIGQRVVCINDNWANPLWVSLTPNKPKASRAYVIRAIHLDRNGESLNLDEIVNVPRQWNDGFYEARFLSWRFRPLDERTYDISVFEKMLTPKRKRVPA